MNETPTSDLAYRFEYADESAFEVYVDGRAFITTKSGRREEKFGKITNNIPTLLGRIAKPRQDEIDRLKPIEVAARALQFSAYPAHGSGFVITVTSGNINDLKAALQHS